MKIAIIIGNNSGRNATNHLEGVNWDLKNYQNYLKDDIGGKWQDAEIVVLHNKTSAEIKATIDRVRNFNWDYTLVVFTGHGYINARDKLTYLCVSDGDISENDLQTQCPKQTQIFDCCRSVEYVSESSNFSGQNLAKGGTIGFVQANTHRRVITDARNKFETAINNSDKGICKAYSCIEGQTSGDNPNSGGVFSTALLKVGYDFGSRDRSDGYWLPIREAVEETKNKLKRDRLTTQIPSFVSFPPNMRNTHPFAITNKTNLIW
jgi:hypothetical protein